MATPSATYNEQELVTALQRRDEKAFGFLYDNYSGALNSIIRQIIQDRELASDTLQEVFINIWRKIESYDPSKGRLFTWMMNIARNASIDIVRSKSYQNAQKNQELPNHVNSSIISQVIIPDIDNIGFKKTLENLKVEHRILIDLAYFKGFTHEEIAKIEGLPLGTVKTRIRSALVQLRQLLR